jgi:tetratricopeptide (TPR) repeat protein
MHHLRLSGARLREVALSSVLVLAALGCQSDGGNGPETAGRGHPLLRNTPIVIAGPTITTKSPQAQTHFEAGLRSYYEGNREAAVGFFETAAELDPGCGMCFWGVALASAPTPGAPEDPAKAARAATAIGRAQKLEPVLTAPERGHIEALVLRVTPAGGPDAASRQKAYARAVQSLASQYPGDLDAVTLAAEASLATATLAAAPSKGVSAGPSEAGDSLQALRGVLATDPNHPGAQRLYNHTLRRTLLTKWQEALMAGQEAQAMAAAREIQQALSDEALRDDPDLQGAATATMFTLARFGHWKEILQLPAPRNDLHYVVGMWYYTRGLAFTRLAQFLDVPPEQAELEEATERVPADQTVLGTTNAKRQLQLAALVLDAEIEHMRAHRENSLKQIREAVKLEDSLGNPKPSAFYVPARQIYGVLLLWNERPREAEGAFREDLERNPENGWALLGLAQSLQAQKRVQEATEVKARAQRAHASADVKPPTSVF